MDINFVTSFQDVIASAPAVLATCKYLEHVYRQHQIESQRSMMAIVSQAIAPVRAELAELRRWARTHEEQDKQRFANLTQHVKIARTHVDEILDWLDEDPDELPRRLPRRLKMRTRLAEAT